MNFKSVIIIIATLFLGFVLGMLTSAQIRYQKLKPVKVFFSEDRFREGIYNFINPDDMQKEKLDVIIKKYARLNRDIQTNFRKELESFTKNLWKEMGPILTAEQKEKLEEIERKRQEFSRQGRGRPTSDTIRGDNDMRHRMRPPGSPDSNRTRMPADSLARVL